jgi:ribosome-associated translation inhibitor RaiA
MSQTDFSYEFTTNIAQPDEQLRTYAEAALLELAEGHTDMIGAAVAVEELTGSNTPHSYRARIVVYMRPQNTNAEQKADDPMKALQQALNTLKRQIREYRDKLRESWKHP